MKVLMVNTTLKVKGGRTLGLHALKKIFSVTLARLISLMIFENNNQHCSKLLLTGNIIFNRVQIET
jgi:hypothetical protein